MLVAMSSARWHAPESGPAADAVGVVRWALEVLLLLAAGATVATGMIADRLDLHDLGLHRQLGYVMAGLALVHVVVHRRALRPPRFRRRPPPRPDALDAAPDRTTAAPAEIPSPAAPPPLLGRRAALVSGLLGMAGAGAGWLARGAVEPTPYDGGDVGLFYHRESSLGLKGLLGNLLDWGTEPERYKTVSGLEPLPLPPVTSAPGMSVADALQQRRSRREYADRALSAGELAWIVAAASKITADDDRRTAPSAGALHPIELYVAAGRVDGIPAGLYHVDVRGQALEPLRHASVPSDLVLAALGQGFVGTAPAVLVLTGYFQRTRWKYHARHYRYVCWEAGHIAQNVYLAAEAAGLAACVVGAFLDGVLNDALGIDGRTEAALGLVAVGARRQ